MKNKMTISILLYSMGRKYCVLSARKMIETMLITFDTCVLYVITTIVFTFLFRKYNLFANNLNTSKKQLDALLLSSILDRKNERFLQSFITSIIQSNVKNDFTSLIVLA